MPSPQNPSLARLYNCSDDTEFLYLDETFLGPEEGVEESFYAITAAKYRKGELAVLGEDLINIVGEDLFRHKGSPYWHATEALQTTDGAEIFEAILEYLSRNQDTSFVTCKVSISSPNEEQRNGRKTVSPIENARRDCLEELLGSFLPNLPMVAGLVFEERRTREDNNRDRNFLKKLTNEGVIPGNFGRAWVSPREETALWVPDTVGMAYRRTRTHTDRTSQYFFDYLNDITEVREF